MKKPRQVESAARRADELHQQQHTQAEPQQPAQPEQQPTQQPQPQQAPQQAPQQPQQAPQAPQAPQQPQQPQQPVEDWEQRYRTLQGMYRRETTDMREQLDQLRAALEDVKERQTASPARQVEEPIVTQEELDEYGNDLIGLITKVSKREAERIAQEMVHPLQQRTEQLDNRFREDRATELQDRTRAYLDTNVTGWREINQEPGFRDWAMQPDRFSGAIRHNLLMDAFKRGDGARVAEFFNAYRASRPTAEPQPASEQQHHHQMVPGSQPVDLSQYAAPSANGSSPAAQPQPPQAEYISQADISLFYADVARGKYRNHPDQKADIEARIAQAVRTGRITQ